MISLKKYLIKNLELYFWSIAIILLFFMNADSDVSLCFFHWLGFTWCPGCGIGHAISSALHFQFSRSLQQHPLGIIAVLIIFNRIRQLIFHQNNLYHEQQFDDVNSGSRS